MNRPLTIVPYDGRWVEAFRAVALPMRTALGELARRIDHIGSTAVPGLAAKDIIDVQVSVRSLTPSEPIARALAGIGYTMHEGIARDHVPPGMEDDPAEWAKLFFLAPAAQRPTNLHVRVEGRANQRYAILFRDYLRAHPAAAAAYAAIKQQLTRHNPGDFDAYYDIKDPVCDVIMAAAQDWATATGWTPGPSDA